MKKIKLFLVATETDLAEDRMAISDLIGTLNDKYEEKGLYFQVVKPKSVPTESDLAACEEAFILWFHHSDEITAASFEQALSAFQKSGKPKIITYFKQSAGVDVADDVGGFMERLDKDLGHYYNLYEHIDSLRFSLLMQISALESSISLECKNGDLLLEGEKCLSLYDVPCAAGNKALSDLKATLKKATAKFFELRELHADDEDNEELASQYMDASEQRRMLREQVAETEKNILAAALSMARDTAAGALSDRQKEAYRLFEKGDYEGANAVLDFGEIKEDIKSAETVAATASDRLQTGVNELLQKISVLMAGTLSQQTYGEIESCYREAVRVEETHNLPKTAMEQFFLWQREHHQNTAAIELGEKLLLYKKLGNASPVSTLSALAELYYLLQEPQKAESYCTQILEQATDTAQDTRHQISAYVILSKIQCRRADYHKAKSLIVKAQEQYRTVVTSASRTDVLEMLVPLSEQSMEVYTQLDNYEMVAAICDRTLTHLLSGVNMEASDIPPVVLEWHLKFIRLHLEMSDSVDAERYVFFMQQRANVIEEDPIKYGPILGEMYLLLIQVAESGCFFEAALHYAGKALAAVKPVYLASPKTHWALMAKCQLAYGKALYAMDYGADAKKVMTNAVQICEENAKDLEELDNKALLSEIYAVLGEAWFYAEDDLQQGLNYFDKAGSAAAEIADQWGSLQNIHRYCRVLVQAADCLTSARVLYPVAQEHIDAAIEFYEKDLKPFHEMTYLAYAKAHHIRGVLSLNIGQSDRALNDFEREIVIIDELRHFSASTVLLPRDLYALFLAYEGKAAAYQDLNDARAAHTAYQKAVACFEEIEPLFSIWHPSLRENWGEEIPWPYLVDDCPKMNARHSRMLLTLGGLSEELDDDEKAETCYENAVAIAGCNPLLTNSDGLYAQAQCYWASYVGALETLVHYGRTHEQSYLHDFDILLVLVQGGLKRMEAFLQNEPQVLLAAQRARVYEIQAELLTDKAAQQEDAAIFPEILALWQTACDSWGDAIEQREAVLDLCEAVTGLLACRRKAAEFCGPLSSISGAADAEARKLLSGNVNTIARWESEFTEKALPLLFEEDGQAVIHRFSNEAARSLGKAADIYRKHEDIEKALLLCQKGLHFCQLVERSCGNGAQMTQLKSSAAEIRKELEQKIFNGQGGK